MWTKGSVLKKSLIALLVLACSCPAYADEPVALEYQGRPGVWLDREAAARVLDRLERSEIMEEMLVEQEEVIGRLRVVVKSATTALSISEDARAREAAYGARGWQMYREEVTRGREFWRQGWFWGVLGAVVAGGAVAAGVAAAK